MPSLPAELLPLPVRGRRKEKPEGRSEETEEEAVLEDGEGCAEATVEVVTVLEWTESERCSEVCRETAEAPHQREVDPRHRTTRSRGRLWIREERKRLGLCLPGALQPPRGQSIRGSPVGHIPASR